MLVCEVFSPTFSTFLSPTLPAQSRKLELAGPRPDGLRLFLYRISGQMEGLSRSWSVGGWSKTVRASVRAENRALQTKKGVGGGQFPVVTIWL